MDIERLGDVTSLSKKVRTIEEKHTNLEGVVGYLSSDVLLNSDEMENLKVFVNSRLQDLPPSLTDDDDDEHESEEEVESTS